jgi:hypothetical protein
MIKLNITPTFMLLHNSPLIQNRELYNSYKLNYDHQQQHLSRFFWTAEINPDNTFDARYDRWHELVKLSQDLGYTIHGGMALRKWRDELDNMKKLYNEYKPKKVFPIHRN